MKPTSTLFLRVIILLIGLAVLVLCLFALPVGLRGDASGYYRPIVLGMYIAAVPFFTAVYQTLKLLDYIDHNQAFSAASVKTLSRIKYCALAISGVYAIGLPYIYYVADHDDAPGVMAVGLLFMFAPLVAAVFAAVLQRLLQDALDIKSENDLTV